MDTIASQITSLTIVYSTVYSDADQRKYQSSSSLAFGRGIHQRPVNSPHNWPVTRKMFQFDDVIMVYAKGSHQSEVESGLSNELAQRRPPFTHSADEMAAISQTMFLNSFDSMTIVYGCTFLIFVPKGSINDMSALVQENALAPSRRQAII